MSNSLLHIYSGISYHQCKSLVDDEISKENDIKEDGIRKEEINQMCSYVDCSLSNAQKLCPSQCFGSKY